VCTESEERDGVSTKCEERGKESKERGRESEQIEMEEGDSKQRD
jgi:hypothetical protein